MFLKKLYFNGVFTLSVRSRDSCVCLHLKHKLTNVYVDVEGFLQKVSLALSSLSTCLSLPSRSQKDSDSTRMVASSLHILPLQNAKFWRRQCLWLTFSLSCRPPFNCCFSYSCRQKVVFAASHPCVSVTGIFPAFCACVCVCAGMHVYVCRLSLSLCMCVYMCEYFSGAEAAFMSVPSIENGSASEGQPLLLHWASTLFRRAKCLYLMLNLCYLSMKLQLRTCYTCGTDWVIFFIAACGYELKCRNLLLCHPLLSLTCGQLLL